MSGLLAEMGFGHLLRFTEPEQHLIRPATNVWIKNGLFVIVVGITKLITMRFERETSCFDLLLHADWIDPMQRLGIPQSRARFGDMVDDQKNSSRFQCVEDDLVYSRNIRRPQKGVM